tara:strand:- start:1419 stop:3212 length:1794 start_codon:yes stop_codon:yes gene_type:complete
MIKQKSPYSSEKILIFGLWEKLSNKRKFHVFCMFLMTILSGFAEILNLSAVVPFLLLLTDTDKLSNVPFLINFVSYLGIESNNDLIVLLTLLFAFTALLTGLVQILNLWLSTRLTALIGNDLSKQAYRITLLKPYIMHIEGNSSAILHSIANNIPATIKIIDRTLTIINSTFVAFSLLIGLLIFNSKVTVLVTSILLVIYFAFAYFSKLRLRHNSMIGNQNQKKQIKIIQESLGSIRDIIIFNCKKIYLNKYNNLDISVRKLYGENLFLAIAPRYGIESFALFFLITSSLLLRNQDGFQEGTLVILGVFALAAQRLLPNLQKIYSSLSTIRANSNQAANILEILNQRIPKDNFINSRNTLDFEKKIKLNNIFFKYTSSGENIIKGISFELYKGEKIGIIGKTGSGKTTLIDIFLGLIKPYKGKIIVDGIDIHDPNNPETLIKWQNLLSYVPQDIYLNDNSFLENIAYGVPLELINFKEVVRCAKNASIHEFIKSTPNGYETSVGERGIKLSGGQLQRIGIARALYKKSKIIIFDEATSALDKNTETKVIESIRSLNKDLTTIMIAHRLNSLVNCDRIIDIDSGKINRILTGRDLIKM